MCLCLAVICRQQLNWPQRKNIFYCPSHHLRQQCHHRQHNCPQYMWRQPLNKLSFRKILSLLPLLLMHAVSKLHRTQKWKTFEFGLNFFIVPYVFVMQYIYCEAQILSNIARCRNFPQNFKSSGTECLKFQKSDFDFFFGSVMLFVPFQNFNNLNCRIWGTQHTAWQFSQTISALEIAGIFAPSCIMSMLLNIQLTNYK